MTPVIGPKLPPLPPLERETGARRDGARPANAQIPHQALVDFHDGDVQLDGLDGVGLRPVHHHLSHGRELHEAPDLGVVFEHALDASHVPLGEHLTFQPDGATHLPILDTLDAADELLELVDDLLGRTGRWTHAEGDLTLQVTVLIPERQCRLSRRAAENEHFPTAVEHAKVRHVVVAESRTPNREVHTNQRLPVYRHHFRRRLGLLCEAHRDP